MAKTKQPKQDQPHAGVDRRRNDMAGRKYAGTRWDDQPLSEPMQPRPPKKVRDR